MERIVDLLVGILAGLLVGLVTVILGTIRTVPSPSDAVPHCIELMVVPLVVGGICGGFVSLRLGRNRSLERLQLRRRRRNL